MTPGAGRRLTVNALIAGLIGVFLYRSLWLPLSVLNRYEADFHHYYNAAAQVLAGLSPYSARGFDYPPLTPLIVVPVAWLPYPQARVVWLLVNWLCLTAAGGLLVRILGGDRGALLTVAALWALSGTVAENLVLGQVNPLLLFLLVLAWWGISRNRGSVAAVAIGLATALKLWPGVLLLALAPHWRRVAGGLAAGLGFFPLSPPPPLLPPPPPPPRPPGHFGRQPAPPHLSPPPAGPRAGRSP